MFGDGYFRMNTEKRKLYWRLRDLLVRSRNRVRVCRSSRLQLKKEIKKKDSISFRFGIENFTAIFQSTLKFTLKANYIPNKVEI